MSQVVEIRQCGGIATLLRHQSVDVMMMMIAMMTMMVIVVSGGEGGNRVVVIEMQ
jgi:hypothetical protein